MLLAQTVVSGASLAERARAMARRLGERLLGEKENGTYDARGLATLAGHALAFDALARATGDARYADASREHLRRAVSLGDVPPIGLFTGISGLRGVAALFAQEEPRYGRLVEQCDAYVEERLPETADARVSRFDDFDVISGWAGARLARCVTQRRGPDRLTDLLAWLMRDDRRWACVHSMRPNAPPENDLGLAHGIAGVLASIALTAADLDGELAELAGEQARRLADRAVVRGERIGWPGSAQDPAGTVVRSAWCYGAPGVAAALLWTAQRLGDDSLAELALRSLEGEGAVSIDQWGAGDHALCHGSIGNALVFASAGRAAGSASLLEAAQHAVAVAVDGLERDGGACWGKAHDSQRYDLSGELDGAAGIALGLLTLTGDYHSRWLTLHALAPWPEDASKKLHDSR